ncbi:flagellar hook assembly protein FlgD [Coralloluteibacterium stylophorae]|uniref:Basal-body rod modification protein FlgD n=1 Tax=Coralloluteibacterium stylophorae TaxID=1776034 RepID=A0A8J7VVY2_9GAMM|nr:flagellar hook assembly protein FlgD [Coralloluteibacterium stylophorae]MBS7457196.1 flagellar hook assembly protein FlgD [Coralloluteibacterium stylophorae]
MTTVGSTQSSTYADLGLAATTVAKEESMGQADFLTLLTEQLKHQDPLNPMENSDFVAQLAQFTQVQGIQEMQTSLNAMASVMESDQALRAVALVGHEALVDASSIQLKEGVGLSGQVEAETAGTVTVDITDADGALVRRLTVAAEGAGSVPFTWDGLDADGETAPAGVYSITASQGAGDAAVALPATLRAKVESVALESSGLSLNLEGIGSVRLGAIRNVGG